MIARIANLAFAFLLIARLALAPAVAQDDKLDQKELDQLLAPIALYPDELLTNILMASTYPLDVVQAARWVKEPANAKLKDEALVKAVESKEWDPSVKALVQFPTVLQNMSDKLDWTQKLGDAFLAQQDEVMNQIQFLRQKADQSGNLKSNKQQKVTKEPSEGGSSVYVIEPAESDVVYVPYYQPSVVYGDWLYDDYPPYYWDYSGADYVGGWWWGPAIATAGAFWGWNHFDWGHHNIDIDVDRWNKIDRDRNRNRVVNNKWEHNPTRRGAVPYKNKDVRQRFSGPDRQIGNKEVRGHDRDIDRSKIETKLKDTDHSRIRDNIGDRDRDAIKDELRGSGTGQRTKDNPGDKAGATNRDKIGDRDRDAIKDELRGSGTGQRIKDNRGDKAGATNRDKIGDRDRDAIKNELRGSGTGQRIKDNPGDKAGATIRDKPGDHRKAGGRQMNRQAGGQQVSRKTGGQKVNRSTGRPKASPAAFNAKRGSNVRSAAQRGRSSPVAMRGGGGRPGGVRGGGGGARGGGRRSDVTAKHDIILLGRFSNGIGLYRFAYNGSQKLYVGVIAQEVMKVMPQAVARDGEGYLGVDYDQIGLPFQTYDHWLVSGARIPKLNPQ